jgi:hypothetical protein
MTSVPFMGGVSSLWLRALDGDSDRSSREPAIYVSIMDSFDVHGLPKDSGGRTGATELRNGTSTDSSISSKMILTAGSSSAGSGGMNS